MKMCTNKKRMYFLCTNQLGIILPSKDFCTKKFMWSCLIGLKKYMSKEEDIKALTYKEHKPGFVIKENSLKYWCEYLEEFPSWELYVPDPYIKKIKREAQKDDLDRRNYIAFDTKYLLSVLRSLDEVAYSNILRKQF